MKGKISKVTAILLAVMMVFAMTPVLAFADTPEPSQDDLGTFEDLIPGEEADPLEDLVQDGETPGGDLGGESFTQDMDYIPVMIEFGSTHKAIAKKFCDSIKANNPSEPFAQKTSVKGSVVTIYEPIGIPLIYFGESFINLMSQAGYGYQIGDEVWCIRYMSPAYPLNVKPQSSYETYMDYLMEMRFPTDPEEEFIMTKPIVKGKTYYMHWFKKVTVNEDIDIQPPICGTEVTVDHESSAVTEESQKPMPIVTTRKYSPIVKTMSNWMEVADISQEMIPFEGKVVGGESYSFALLALLRYGQDYTPDSSITINGEPVTYPPYPFPPGYGMFTGSVQAVHAWDKGVMNKDGTATYTCTGCGKTKTEVPQKAADGTPCGQGASFIEADAAITGLTSDKDPAGSTIAPLKLKSTKQGKKNITLSWSKPKGATSFVIYGNLCGKTKKIKKIKETSSTSYVKKSLKKGKYYKYIVVALNGSNEVVATSKMIHVATKGGKVTNYKSATIKIKKGKKYVKASKATVATGKSLTLKVSAAKVSKKLKVKKHIGTRYQSSNPAVATVSSKGVVKGVAAGKCDITAYTQNGVNKTIVVTVK